MKPVGLRVAFDLEISSKVYYDNQIDRRNCHNYLT